MNWNWNKKVLFEYMFDLRVIINYEINILIKIRTVRFNIYMLYNKQNY